MSFIEAPSFPLALSYGATGGPVYSTDLVQRSSGIESRNRNWREPRCQWDIGSQHRTQAEVDALVQFFHAVAQGMEHSFRFRDFTDDTFDNSIGVGDGSTTTFQLVKVYTYGAQSVTRTLVKPMAGGLHLSVAGVAVEEYDPDFTTGLVTFWTPPAAGAVVSASGVYEVPTRFNQNVLPLTRVALHAYSADKIELVEVRLEALDEQLKALYARTVTSFAMCWKVTRSDGQVFGFVDHDQDLTIDGVTYRAAEGLGTTAAQATADLQPGTLDVSAFLDVSTEGEMEAGIWDEAAITAFEAPWDAPPSTLDPTQANILTHGKLGQITRQTGRFTAQLHGLTEQLDTAIGRMYLPGCPWRLGDSRCQINLAEWTRTGTVMGTGADPRYSFHDDAQGEAPGWFAEGVMTMTSGANAGRSTDIRLWEPPWFTFHRPFPYPVAVGDTYSAVTGDDKTFATCSDTKFSNQNRFGGFPMLPGPDAVMQNPLVTPANQQDMES